MGNEIKTTFTGISEEKNFPDRTENMEQELRQMVKARRGKKKKAYLK